VRTRSRVLLLCGTGLVSSAATLWVLLVGLAPHEPRVSYDALAADVRAGRVASIHIEGRDYTYALRVAQPGAIPERRSATGPEPTIAQLRALRPADPDERPPTIDFEP
jgi:hypothetical protein